MQLHWLWLNSRKNVGPLMALRLLENFPSIEALYRAGEQELGLLMRRDSALYRTLMDKSMAEPQRILEDCRKRGISVLTLGDADYPARLKQIADPPLVLFYKGTLPDFEAAPAISIVGTRSATRYGLNTANRLGREVAQAGGIVVSGLAGGIDSAAMDGALSAGGTVVGVLGCGADVVYPANNGMLYDATARSGCIITEFIPGTLPVGRNFPRRNRIISGLSCGVVVVEAPARSGALITASMALEQGREVYAVPGNLDRPESAGTLGLIRQGAAMAENGRQIVEDFGNLFDLPPYVPSQVPVRANSSAQPQKKVDNPDKKPYSDKHKVLPDLSEDEKSVYSRLTDENIHVDELVFQLGIGASRTLAALTMLQIKGLIQQHPGKYYSLA